MQGFIIMAIVFVLVIIIGLRIEPKKHTPIESSPPPEPIEYDIVQHSNGKFSPTYQGRYCFVTIYDSAITVANPNKWIMFESKEDAKEFLEQWKIIKGLGKPKSVGL